MSVPTDIVQRLSAVARDRDFRRTRVLGLLHPPAARRAGGQEKSRSVRRFANWRVLLLAVGASLALSSCAPPHPATVTFDPPYPETNANGDPILVVFEGRIPCIVANCENLKVGLVLYQERSSNTQTTYWLGVVGTRGNDRVVTEGTWAIRHGVEGYPRGIAYELDATTPSDLRHYWRVNEDILLVLDERKCPKAGNSAWGYMLSRYAAPYGPRTYVVP